MTIRSNLGTAPIDVLAADTALYDQPANVDRYQVTACNVFNDTGASITVDIYISPNLTSASGQKVESVILGAGIERDINAVIGQGYTNQNVIAIGSAVGVNATITVTTYDGGD